MWSRRYKCTPPQAAEWPEAASEAGFRVQTFATSPAAINVAERYCGPISGENPTFFDANLGGIVELGGVILHLDIWQGEMWSSNQPPELCWAGFSPIPKPFLIAGRSTRQAIKKLDCALGSVGFARL